MLKRLNPTAQVTIIYRDIRTYGFKEQLYAKAREAGVLFVRYDFDRKPEVTSEDGQLTVRAWEEVLGRSVQESIGRPFTDFVPGAKQNAFKAQRGCRLEVQLPLHGGLPRWIEVTSWPSACEGYVGTIRDVTEKKETQRELQRQRRRPAGRRAGEQRPVRHQQPDSGRHG